MLFLSSSENEICMGIGNDLQNLLCGGKQVQEEKKKCLWSSTSLLCPNVCANPKVQALTERMFLKKEFLINFQAHT